ncbi:hypothetical protein ACFVBP_10545 [Nocardioides sp. NPDC057764]|uniref:hypothetical protein n=1 Tax=Nocardioides sp. NPDC057764 TaxID=3346243 RepID=UPI003671F67C
MVVLHSKIREIPPDHRGGYDLEVREIQAEGDTYELAKAKLESLVPEKGWQMLWIGRY